MNQREVIQVMLVDDHSMVRRGLATFLEFRTDLVLFGEASTGIEAIQQCEIKQPDIILMDLVMPEMDGLTASRIINKRWPQIKIIALTTFPDKEMVLNAHQAGVTSYLLKNVTSDQLADAIRAAFNGRSTLAPEAKNILSRSKGIDSHLPGHDLTPRERQVLDLLVEGLNNPEIATRLNVSRSTARAHVSQIFSKFGVSNRAEAISLAFRVRLVT